ncbi:hypothetical protein B0T24DRAFT_697265, partial [Lasiosphaeria ovina]
FLCISSFFEVLSRFCFACAVIFSLPPTSIYLSIFSFPISAPPSTLLVKMMWAASTKSKFGMSLGRAGAPSAPQPSSSPPPDGVAVTASTSGRENNESGDDEEVGDTPQDGKNKPTEASIDAQMKVFDLFFPHREQLSPSAFDGIGTGPPAESLQDPDYAPCEFKSPFLQPKETEALKARCKRENIPLIEEIEPHACAEIYDCIVVGDASSIGRRTKIDRREPPEAPNGWGFEIMPDYQSDSDSEEVPAASSKPGRSAGRPLAHRHRRLPLPPPDPRPEYDPVVAKQKIGRKHPKTKPDDDEAVEKSAPPRRATVPTAKARAAAAAAAAEATSLSGPAAAAATPPRSRRGAVSAASPACPHGEQRRPCGRCSENDLVCVPSSVCTECDRTGVRCERDSPERACNACKKKRRACLRVAKCDECYRHDAECVVSGDGD